MINNWLADGPSGYGGPDATSGCHLLWRAPSRTTANAFCEAAKTHGGRHNGPPGVRAIHHLNDCGAFVIDPDGDNVEAVCNRPA